MATVVHIPLLILLLHTCFGSTSVEALAGHLPDEEKGVLEEIAEQLGKKDWKFELNPCDGNSNWNTLGSISNPFYNNTITCNCSFPNGECHVDSISLKGQDLAGVLPPALAKLSYLKKIDLARNYLSGNIPPEWETTKLETLSISMNRLSGRIPNFLGNITTLKNLGLEANLFSGTVPPELGKLVDLQKLILNSNNLTGPLPQALAHLTNLKELRVSSNNFTGKIPSFIQSWKQLEQLEIQASGLEGPIPSNISVLSNLTELRISDLNGEGSTFPPLRSMKRMYKLMLRGCNISGPILPYIAEMTELRFLDLSFNKLNGEIPNLDGLTNVEVMCLTGNRLNGNIPDGIKGRQSHTNLFRSFFEEGNLELGGCLENYPCQKNRYSLHINCGGEKSTVGNVVYEGDQYEGGAAKFHPMTDYWGFSSIGHFWDHNRTINDYIAQNVSVLGMNHSELYTRARLSPLSFTYYGRCLADGNYIVKIHFAEIIIRGNKSFHSLGRQIFNVYIQGKLESEDFDIVQAARGVEKVVVKEFKAVVKNKTLEVRFHWAGKGTTAIPSRGTYGPLISAISVESGV